jgi:predicted RNA-binding Zn-ribbon protein involved in translation (DUF1610 family)
MRRPSKKRIAEAIKHYRCEHCGAVGAGFVLDEARILHQFYDESKGRWVIDDSYPVEGHEEEVTVCCGACGEPLITRGWQISVEEFQEWLLQFTLYHEHLVRRQAEQARVREDFTQRQDEGFLSLGETKAFKKRLKELEEPEGE